MVWIPAIVVITRVVRRPGFVVAVSVRRLMMPRLTRAPTDSLRLASAIPLFSVTAHAFVALGLWQRVAVLPSLARLRRVAPNAAAVVVRVSAIVVIPRVVRRPGFVVAVSVRRLRGPVLTRASTDSLLLASAVISFSVTAHGFVAHLMPPQARRRDISALLMEPQSRRAAPLAPLDNQEDFCRL